ncbi:MAG TPA: von Willebrand factor type A domain-containing protein [Opitutaceae bacterium]|nr:von Willebrand factor type A domain-containing protein [Opitutaceae bacterium]
MTQKTLLSDDPRLTAYALGELEADERAIVETMLRENPAARAAVEEIRATAAQLAAALAAEPALETTPVEMPSARRAAIIPGSNPRTRDGPSDTGRKVLKFPQLYYVIGMGAAACFAVVVVLRESPWGHRDQLAAPTATENKQTEPTLAKAVAEKPAAIPTGADAVPPPVAVAAVTETPVPVAEVSTEEPTPATETTAPRSDLSLLAQVKNPAENFPEIRERMDLDPVKDAVASSTVAAQEKIAESFSSTVEPITVPSISIGKVVVAALPPNQVIPSASLMQVAPVVPTQTARTLALYDRNKNGRIDPDEMAAMRPAQVAYAASPSGNDVVKLMPFQVSSSSSKGYAGRFQANEIRPDLRPARPSPPVGARFGSTEDYAHITDNEFLAAQLNPLSTFSIDTDTASYTNVRRFLQGGALPPKDAVRVEELLNYFSYDYAPPRDDKPFAASLEVASAPWAPSHRLVRIGLKGREIATADRPAANLVFLLDVSGSMNEPNRLPLVKEAMRLLVGKLRTDDRVAIVVYAAASGLALPSTPVSASGEILAALDELEAGGSTNGSRGIQLAYDIAKANFVAGGLNRVILCTDGDFNVGMTSEGELTRLIEEKAKSGVFLTVLGFGMGNLKDSKLEKLAGKGNGNYGYIDTRKEAEKMLVEQVSGTLMAIAKDVKIQVEFNPAKVASYRLIGYENRLLKKEDFNNDKVDAGEIGAGHTLTALYEVVPVGAEEKPAEGSVTVDDLKYQAAKPAAPRSGGPAADNASNELLTVKIRYKKPDGILSRKLEFPLVDNGTVFANASVDFKFAAAVAGFGMILRDSPYRGVVTLGDVVAWAGPGIENDPRGYRGEFITLVNLAKSLGR